VIAFRIREARLPGDRAAFHRFIMGSQAYEHDIEPDRRLDPPVAEEHLERLLAGVAKHNGKILVVEAEDGTLLGWSVAHERENEVFVVEALRLHGYISELFVQEFARSKGIGRALIAACEIGPGLAGSLP
jgi:GNAT superfamily N-acetyltransferase